MHIKPLEWTAKNAATQLNRYAPLDFMYAYVYFVIQSHQEVSYEYGNIS
jgi:hypothetical protein